MKKFILILMLLCNSVQAYEIVYPKKQNVTINSDKTFFIGNGDLTINGQNIETHQSGGFKYVVNLNIGLNKFTLQNGKQKDVYTIYRPMTNVNNKISQIENFEKPFVVIILSDNTPLRSTPVDSGLNRLQHLSHGIELLAVAQYDNFYKVMLARDDFAWISKSNVKKLNKDNIEKAQLINVDYEITDDKEIFTFKLNKKLPYVLSDEKQGYNLVIYGLQEEFYPFGKFEFPIAHNGKNFGYKSYYNHNELIVEINKYFSGLKGLNITIDAGHGGNELGAIGCLGDKEKDINLQIAKKLKEKLTNAGAIVYMTRETDKNLGLNERVNITNKNNSQIFISIHNNAVADVHADKKTTGTEVYYFYQQSKELAKSILTGITNKTGLKNNGVKGGSFAVIRNTNAVSILVEAGYMIEPEDNAKLRDEDFQNAIADGILEGLENYLK